MKKFLVGMAAAAAMILPVSAGAVEDQILWGDTNCTGYLDAGDMVNVKRALIDLPITVSNPCAEGFSPSPTDLNCNGYMDASDLVIIKRLLIDLPVDLPADCP